MGIAYEALYEQMRKLIVQPLKESGISTVIVIDALDECKDEEPASAILSVLGQLAPEIPDVKFFLTGRPEPHITEGFRLPLLAKITDTLVLRKVGLDQVDSDIRLFFKHSFFELANHRDGFSNWPTKEQLDQLCKRAAGLFLYAAAAAKFIGDNKRDPKERLDTLLQSQKIGAREGKVLDLLYAEVLQEAFGNDPEDDSKNRSILGAVVLVINPLSPSAIAKFLEFDVNVVLSLLSSIHSLLIFQDANHPVQPFHKSFLDFITDSNRCNQRFYISPPDHHLELLVACLSLMNKALEKNMCQLPEAVANSDVSDLEEKIKKHIDPALQYACISWHTHLNDSYMIPDHLPTIVPPLKKFLETKFLFWLEVLSVCGVVRNAVNALQATEKLMEVC